MKPLTAKLLAKAERVHDWDEGQTFGKGGTRYETKSVCRLCSLQRVHFTDDQNGIDFVKFTDLDGREVSLRTVAKECK